MTRRAFITLTPICIITLILLIVFGQIEGAAQSPQNQDQQPATSGVAEARGDNVEIAVRAGFGRVQVNVSSGVWVPFRIEVANNGRPITGKLVVRGISLQNPNSQYREFYKQVQLPTGARQLHEISAFLSTNEPVFVQLVSDGQVYVEAEIQVQGNWGQSDEMEVSVVDTDPTTLNSITSTEIQATPARQPFTNTLAPDANPAGAGGQIGAAPGPPVPPQVRRRGQGTQQSLIAKPGVIGSEELPRDFVSYDQIDALVIGDAPLGQLTEEQTKALKLWVASGGLLIVTGGADFAGLKASGLDALLPVDVLGAGSVASLGELTGVYGDFEAQDQLLIVKGALRPGAHTLLGSDQSPLAAEKSYGSGLVRFVAINPKLNPYRGWGAAKDLWSDLLLPAVQARPKPVNWITRGMRSNNFSGDFGIKEFLFKLSEIEPPSAKYVLFFLLAYVLAVGPLNYLLLMKWKRKADLAWLTIPAVVLVFTLVSVAVAQLGRGGNAVSADVSVVEVHQDARIARVLGALLIMPSSKDYRDITFRGRDTYVTDVWEDGPPVSATESVEAEQQPEQFKLKVPLNTWASSLFQVRAIRENVAPLISGTSTGSSVTLRNDGSTPIRKAVYLGPDGISALFDLEAGQQIQAPLAAAEALPFTSWYSTQLGPESPEGQIFTDAAFLLDREVGGQPAFRRGFFERELMANALKNLERPLVLCFMEETSADMDFGSPLKRHSWSFYVIHL